MTLTQVIFKYLNIFFSLNHLLYIVPWSKMLRLIILCGFFKYVVGHSWVECVDYDPISFDYQTLGNYDRSRCNGYPRGFSRQYDAGFGFDTGYNWGHADCARDPFKESDYNNKTTMARYKKGQTIYISHPSKNHVADSCTNAFIPSTDLSVKMSSKQGIDVFDISLQLVGGKHNFGQIDHLEYQRCFGFCGDQDKSHCLTGWVIPESIPDGQYSFIWVWEFNTKEIYANCWDAIVSSSDDFIPTIVTTSPSPTPASTITDVNKTINSRNSSDNENVTDKSSADDIVIKKTPVPNTPTPILAPTPIPTVAEVISSASPDNKITRVTYLMNITAFLNISGILNLTLYNI